MTITALGLITCASCFLGIHSFRRWAERHRMVDVPNSRSSHERPVPRGAGVFVVAATLLSWLVLGGEFSEPADFRIVAFALGGALVAGVSWLDDVRSLSWWSRLVTHGCAAGLALWSFGPWTELRLPFADVPLEWFGAGVTFLWIVGLSNAFNFMDGIDGIAGSQGVVAGVGWAVLGWLTEQPLISGMGVVVAAACLGFLRHNWPPAGVFMGDVGSVFLGYTLATLAVASYDGDVRLPFAGCLLVWPFVFDTSFSFCRRLLRGENVLEAHRSHLYQRLVRVGFSHRFVTLLYSAGAIVGGILAVLFLSGARFAGPVVATVLAALCAALVLFVHWKERRFTLRERLGARRTGRVVGSL